MDLCNELHTVKVQLTSLSAELRCGHTAAPVTSGSTDHCMMNQLWDNTVQRYSKLISPYLHKPLFRVAASADIDPASSQHFESATLKQATQAAELYSVVPEELHPLLASRDSSISEMVSTIPEITTGKN